MTRLAYAPLKLPPDDLLRGYLHLIHMSFVYLRSSERLGPRQAQFVHDLSTAMHNISSLIAFYDDGWLNDEKFRQNYLCTFDLLWPRESDGGIRLTEELDDFAAEIREFNERE